MRSLLVLMRERTKLEAERIGLEEVVKEVEREGCNKKTAELTEKDLNKMEERLDKYAKQYDKVVGTLPGDERDGARKERDELYTDFENWTRRTRIKIRQHTYKNPPQVYCPGRSHL